MLGVCPKTPASVLSAPDDRLVLHESMRPAAAAGLTQWVTVGCAWHRSRGELNSPSTQAKRAAASVEELYDAMSQSAGYPLVLLTGVFKKGPPLQISNSNVQVYAAGRQKATAYCIFGGQEPCFGSTYIRIMPDEEEKAHPCRWATFKIKTTKAIS
eukprot:scpid18323/ scgid34427/ 